jgi:hypothetical protein
VFLKDDEDRDINGIKRLRGTGHRAVAEGYTHRKAPYWSRYKSGVITPADSFLLDIGDKAYRLSAASRLAGTGTNNPLRLSVFDPREGGLSAIRSLRFEVFGQDSGGMRRRLVEFRHPMPWDGPEPDFRSLCSVGNYRRWTFPRRNPGCR